MILEKFKRAIQIFQNEGVVVFSKKLLNFLLRKIKEILFYIPTLIKIKTIKFQNLNDLLKFTFSNDLVKPAQIPEEIFALLKILKEKKPKTILEIGTANGGSLFLFCQVALEDAIIISIDLPGGPFGGGYPIWRIPLYKAFRKGKQKLYLIRGDSHKKETLEKVKGILKGRKIDFLFIDGDHTYEGVKKDFEMYGLLVKKGGVIAFHDITPVGNPELVGGVPVFWQEIKNNFSYQEVIFDMNQVGCGIGIIFL